MQAVWKRGGGTVSEVQAELDPPLAYTTVQTMLDILERKGKLKRELNGRAYVYTAQGLAKPRPSASSCATSSTACSAARVRNS